MSGAIRKDWMEAGSQMIPHKDCTLDCAITRRGHEAQNAYSPDNSRRVDLIYHILFRMLFLSTRSYTRDKFILTVFDTT